VAYCECKWKLEELEGQVFCGVCGRACASLSIRPKKLVFYAPRMLKGNKEHTVRSIKFENEGPLVLPLEVEVLHRSFSLGDGSAHRTQNLKMKLQMGGGLINVSALGEFPDADTTIQVRSRLGVENLSVVATVPPAWRLEGAHNKPLDVYPEPGAHAPPPVVRPYLLRGAAIIEKLQLLVERGDELVEVGRPQPRPHPQRQLPLLMRGNERLQVSLDALESGVETLQAVLRVHCAHLPPSDLRVNVHRNLPVDLVSSTDCEGKLHLSPESPAEFRVRLRNRSGWDARLEQLDFSESPFELVSIRVIDAQFGGRYDEPAKSGGMLPTKVLDAVLPADDTGRTPDEVGLMVDSLLLRTSREAHRAIRGEVLGGTIRVMASTKNFRPKLPQELEVQVPAAAIRDLPPDQGYLLVDYGTVHTCAALRLLHPPKGEPARIRVKLEPSRESDAEPFDQIKSCYRVIRWDGRGKHHVGFGHEAWDKRSSHAASTDYAAKLRLGRPEARFLQDEYHHIKSVSGLVATRLFMDRVLYRVAQETGYRPKAFKLSHPVAFDSASREEMMMVFDQLGLERGDIEIQRAEPEAFLYCLLSRELTSERALEEVMDQVADTPEDGMLGMIFDFGGGTTDITLFEYYRKPKVRVRIVGSHGYSWLGGEALTARIAAQLYSTINLSSVEDGRFIPFPEIGKDRGFLLRTFSATSEPSEMRRNYEALCKRAEEIKCDPTRRGVEKVSLVDDQGMELTVDVQADEERLRAIAEELIAPAINDTLKRVLLMDNHGLVCNFAPQFVVAAGNASKLWCLEDLFATHCATAHYRFFESIAKDGVLDGLDADREGLGIPVDTPNGDGGWWFWRRGSIYQLIMPGADAVAAGGDPGELRPLTREPIELGKWTFFRGLGPGDADDGTYVELGDDLRLAGTIEPGMYRGQPVVPRFRFVDGRPSVAAEVVEEDGTVAWRDLEIRQSRDDGERR
jgi:hypothetical protein